MRMYQAAEAVLKKSDNPMKVRDIYEAIVADDLFTFGAKSPVSVLSATLRDHSAGGRRATNALFEKTGPGTYTLLTTEAKPQDD